MRLYFSVFLFLTSSLIAFSQEMQVKRDITLDDLWRTYSFHAQSIDGLESMMDGVHYSVLMGDTAVAECSYETGDTIAILAEVSEFGNPQIKSLTNYQFNGDESKLIFYINRIRIYRRSFTAEYFVWDIKTKQLFPVSTHGVQRLATISPDGTQVAFVRDNNLFITELKTGNETQVTFDGEFNKIINGAPDWVYEEEFEYNQAFSWSPDGKYLAFCRFDESKVKLFNMTVYEGKFPDRKENDLYPQNYDFKYPKAGEDNSVVSVYTYNVAMATTQMVEIGPETNQYIPRIRWVANNNLCVFRLNRLQNKLEFLYANPASGRSHVFYSEENARYIDEENFDNLTFIDHGAQFIFTSERDGWSHIYLYNGDGSLINQVTKGNWDVTEFLGYDAKNKKVYYQSAETSPMQRDIYVIGSDGKDKKKLSTRPGTNDAVFSNGFRYYINYFSNASTPTLVTLRDAKGKQIRVLEDNKALKEKLTETNFVPQQFFTFTTSEGVVLNGWMIKPASFDPQKKYPVLMSQYSGPNSQEVLDQFSVGWEQVLAANGYIVVCVDGRGTGARGEEFRKMTYLELGKYETIDQIETAKYLGKQSYIDALRIGIWGWSYGGFMSLLCMTKGADYFKAGIAVAPVSNWRYYDNIYTERFMRTPQENAPGYDANSPINYVDSLKGKLLICHGSADDNVHLQNTMEISEAFVQANKQFDMFIYTNRNHSIYGGNTRYHLYTKMLNFIKENL